MDQPPAVAAAFEAFPPEIRRELLSVRDLIFALGSELGEGIGVVEESLKWGEPSYTTIVGSTVRLGWNKRQPQSFAVYFHCQTKLVATFRQLYPDTFCFEGNRALVFTLGQPIPREPLRRCLELALTYHRRKHLPGLGADPLSDDARH